MKFTCPVCYYDQLQEPPRDYNICDCCGTEFGNDDDRYTVDELRARWISNGAQWFFENPPALWNPYLQLLKANFSYLPYSPGTIFTGSATATVFSGNPAEVLEDERNLRYAAA